MGLNFFYTQKTQRTIIMEFLSIQTYSQLLEHFPFRSICSILLSN